MKVNCRFLLYGSLPRKPFTYRVLGTDVKEQSNLYVFIQKEDLLSLFKSVGTKLQAKI